jgi:hypothetical protein
MYLQFIMRMKVAHCIEEQYRGAKPIILMVDRA